MIRVVADENIPAVSDALPADVELRLMPGRKIDAAAIRDADALLVRSVTKVDAELLKGSTVRFVASATAGLDHVDVEGLGKAGIVFAWAPGSNAESVAEYVAAAFFHIAALRGADLAGKTVGIVGVGQCGSRVERIARGLGMEPLLCDPPRARNEASGSFMDLRELAGVDFLTLHIPLVEHGRDATWGLISEDFIRRMRPDACLINASRGGVVEEAALLRVLEARRLGYAVIDAWFGEPRISVELLNRATIATPHIAGYSADGKFRGTEMIARALGNHFNLPIDWTPDEALPRQAGAIRMGNDPSVSALAMAVSQAYPIMRDDTDLRAIAEIPPEEAARTFDQLRRDYPVRREFSSWLLEFNGGDAKFLAAAKALGFRIETEA